jgi:iron complex outermembrane receptor protein
MTNGRWRFLVGTVLVGAAAFGATPSNAQDQAQAGTNAAPQSVPPAQAASDQGRAETMPGDIVVTAQRRSENIQNVPITIQAISGTALSNMGVANTTDLGKVASAVNIVLPAGAGNQPVITIRGIGINDNNSNNAGSAGLYVDEYYLSAPTSQTLSLFDVDRVEILKGPQGTLYGRNTSVGAINIITNRPSDTFGGFIKVDVGNYDTYSVEGALTGPITNDVQARVSFIRNYSAGYFTNLFTGASTNGANDYAVRGQLAIEPAANVKILLSTSFARVVRLPDEYRHLGILDPATGATCSLSRIFDPQGGCVDVVGAGNAPGYYQVYGNRTQKLRVTDFGQTMRVDWHPGGLDFSSLSQYHFNKRFLPEDTDANQYRLLEINYFNKSREFTQEFKLGQTKSNFNWVVGLYYLHEDLIQQQQVNQFLDYDLFAGPGAGDLANNGNDITAFIPYIGYMNNKQLTNAYAAYGQAGYHLTDKLELILGGRFTKEKRSFHYDDTAQYQSGGINNFAPPQTVIDTTKRLDNQAFNYRVGLNYTPITDVLLYGSIATGFKSGDFNGGFLSNVPDVAAAQVNPVGPERVTTYEAGFKSRFLDRKVTLNASVYYNDYSNLQLFALISTQVGSSVQIVNTLTSAEKARSYGADIELDVRPIENLTLGAQVGLLRSKLVKYTGANPELFVGRPLVFAPDASAFLTADYRIPMGKNALSFEFNAAYKSSEALLSVADPYLDTQPAYWLEGARVALQVRNLELAAYVQNLTDTHYISTSFSAPGLGFLEIITGRPRTYGLEAKITF